MQYYTPEPLEEVPENSKEKAVFDQSYGDMMYDILYDKGEPLCIITSFNAMSAEENCVIPKQIEGANVTIIKVSAFASCHNLDTVTLPDTVKTMGAQIFHDCGGLKRVYIPASVTYIGENFLKGASQAVICAPKNSYAHQYAVTHELKFEEWKTN